MKLNLFFNFKSYLIAIELLLFFMDIVESSPVLFERDILIEKDVKQMENRPRTKRAASRNIWDFGVIPYVIDENVGFSYDQIVKIKEGMQHWEQFTCIKFVERNAVEHDYFIRFTKLSCGCCSPVGIQRYLIYSGLNVSLTDGCFHKSTILHELGHAIGFWHEHQRPDRDNYVEIQYENILDGLEYSFDKKTDDDVDSLNEAYDYYSIMHYRLNDFSKYVQREEIGTIILKNVGIEKSTIGQLNGQLSPSDIRQTNKLYKCPECGRTFQNQSDIFTSPNFYTKSGNSFR